MSSSFDQVAHTSAASAFCEFFRLELYKNGALPTPDALKIGDHVQLASDWNAINFSFQVDYDVDHVQIVRTVDSVFQALDSFTIHPGVSSEQYICRMVGCQGYVERALECAEIYARNELRVGSEASSWCTTLMRFFLAVALVVLLYTTVCD